MTGTTLLILGASGDLTSRLLLPGLATLLSIETDRRVTLVGADLPQMSENAWRERVTAAFGRADAAEALPRVLGDTRYVAGDATDPHLLGRLLESLEVDSDSPLVIYFALPPQVSAAVCETLAGLDLPENTTLALEKPFGYDAQSAKDLNVLLSKSVPEDRVFRIDHFLGLYTVLNLLGLRFANRLFEPVWDRDSIEKVEIFYDETVTLEGRAGYFDRAGALRDMIQSHLLQVMAVVAMEPPASVGERDLRDAIGQVLRAARVVDPVADSRRARYTAGSIGERAVPDYAAEEGVDPELGTETLAEVEVEVANQRWAGVPFILRSGKSFAAVRKQVVVHFKPPAHIPDGLLGRDTPDTLTIDLRPDTFTLSLTTNGSGDAFTLGRTDLVGALGGSQLEPYGEVLSSMLDCNPRLAVRGDAAEECWRIVEPVLAAWSRDDVPLETYPAGSQGPEGWSSTR
ncbi:glucose-6-phosphate dehydrogenase [Zhihengliuella halotolerans]|uniref:Glucose-6-phosphate 1-dehydrogenase n=1 Tax=Zhihengliuella halotolerans TaxID=370736 RepID=A0A4Q8AFL3_9MICC|nr:glucose-6-phosphate dehydrogenase [Zhihengliuella halotolerans]RZU62483.1 glucose-6-phosphate 1-dehydrogenase [Zhihengliuella halotolerans]